MKLAVLDAATLGDDLDLGMFRQFGELSIWQQTRPEELEAHLRGAEVAILNKIRMTAQVLAAAPDLRLICIAATGFDNVDLDWCRAHGVAVCNVVGYSTRCVSQVTLAMALSLMTHLPEYSESVRSGAYTAGGVANRLRPVYHEIAGKTWGIVGFGNIGRQVGQAARALGCRVLVNKRTPVPDWECVELDALCREADILSLHVPLSEETRGLLDRRRIGLLRPGALVINVARGAVVDEAALAEAVKQGRIGGIGVDVYTAEPLPPDHPYQAILGLPNVCLTPHMAWGGYETRVRLLEEIAENIRSFLSGGRRNRVETAGARGGR